MSERGTSAWRHYKGLYLCEVEAASTDELMRIICPSFVIRDVTGDYYFSGAQLAQLKEM
jgi:CYTH domain-containing protein